MLNSKTLVGGVLALALVAMQVVTAQAAPLIQTGTISGTIQSVSTSTDSSGNTIVVVTLTDSTGATQTANLSVDSAVALGLVTQNPDGSITVNDVAGQSVTIDASLILTGSDPCALAEGDSQPVAQALTSFFCGPLGLDYSTIEGFHTDGFGYGEIAQACFAAEALSAEGTSVSCGDILTAKQNNDISSLGLPGVTNWGQLRKYILGEAVDKSLNNLGAIMSGRAQSASSDASTGITTDAGATHGKSGDHGKGGGNGKGHGHGH